MGIKQSLVKHLSESNLKKIKDILAEDPITVLEVGARRGGKRFRDIGDYIQYIGFEPNKDDAVSLEKKLEKGVYAKSTVLPYTLSSITGESKLYVTKHPGCSSELYPNTSLLKSFTYRKNDFRPFPEHFNVTSSYTCKSMSFDDLIKKTNIEGFDFIGIDTQGTEYPILKSGESIIKDTTLVIHVEMEVIAIYKDQHLFKDVYQLMESFGFRMIGIENLQYASRPPAGEHNSIDNGELISIDGIFVKSIDYEVMNFSQILKYMLLLSSLNFYSLAIDTGKQYIRKKGLESELVCSLADALTLHYVAINKENNSKLFHIKKQGYEILMTMYNAIKPFSKRLKK